MTAKIPNTAARLNVAILGMLEDAGHISWLVSNYRDGVSAKSLARLNVPSPWEGN